MFSLVLPTYNEAKNIEAIVREADEALRDVDHEIIIVDDDSPDETWKHARIIASANERVRVVRRVGRRGLSSAVIEGFLASKGDVVAVMDADGQHETAVLPYLAEAIAQGADIVVASRYVQGGSVGDWDERRAGLSRLATRLALSLCRVPVKDPMSGFFALKREVFEEALPRLNPKGFKILLDFLVHVPRQTRAYEVPMKFRSRRLGESKLSLGVQIEFLEYLYDVTIGRFLPLLFVKYCLVGACGVVVNLAAYYALSRFFGLGDRVAIMGAIEVAIVFNFLLNNVWTFKRTSLRGRRALVGFFVFNVACAFGAIANFAVSEYFFSLGATEFLSVFLGALIGTIWNYTMSRNFTWRT